MNAEWFTAVALPVSVAEDADTHVNVFIAPTLRPDHDDAELGEFFLFRDWGDVVAGGVEVTLVDQLGEFPAAVDTSGLVQALWRKAFGRATPVLANRVPQWQQRDWRTFAAKDCSDIAKAMHLSTIAADPVTPVAPLAHPLAQAMLGVARQTEALTYVEGGDRRHPMLSYDESALTRALDDGLARGRDGAWTTRPARPDADGGVDSTASVFDALRHLHLARRFYERPESQVKHQVVKDPPDKVTPLRPPTAEFHARIAAAGDHPAFLLRLGLVLPLRTDPSRLRRSRWLAAVVRTRVDDGACRSPRLAVQALRDDAFVSTPNPDDPAIWADGALTLGDSAIFDVVDVDPDGSAIKAERFLTTLPRLARAQRQSMPADAATPALRASGLTLTRRQQAGRAVTQLERQEGYQGALETAAPPQDLPMLHTQDVTRGVRVEVWDSVSKVWHSLHSRRSTLLVDGEKVYTDDLNDGFIQGTSASETRGVPDSAVHVHEAMFGWEGWSLSAPRPGKRVRPVLSDAPNGGSRITETPEPTPTTLQGGEEPPPHPFVFTHRFAEGTLPRLRFGRDYSFRAWAVDLAGGVRAHHVGPRAPDLDAIAANALGLAPLSDRALTRRLTGAAAQDVPAFATAFIAAAAVSADGVAAGLDPAVFAGPPPAEGVDGGGAEDMAGDAGDPGLGEQAGARLLAGLTANDLHTVVLGAALGRPAADAVAAMGAGAEAGADAGKARARDLGDLQDLGVRGAEARRLLAEAPAPPDGVQSRVAAVGAAFRRAASAGTVVRSPMLTDVDTSRELIAGHLADLFGGPRPVDLTPPIVRQAASTITPPRPFLRWDPVPPPVVVPLTAFTEGESLQVVVVRSGVSQDPVTLEVTTQEPGDYAASVAAVAPLYAPDAKRHLAAPKTSQGQAELHGEFDAGIDVGTPAARRQMLAWALRESGTFYDRTVPHPTDPSADPIAQPGVRLLPEPSSGPYDLSKHYNPSDPTRPLKVLPPAADEVPKELVLSHGEAPAPGQYVVHDTPDLALPYLPDPLAIGVSLAFLEAGSGRHVAFPWGAEQVTARYPGTWPEREPFLLTLRSGAQLGATIEGRGIGIQLPPGDVQTFRLASSLDRERLPWLGVWRSLDDSLTTDDDVREAAADGLLWSLTPGEEVRLVHAVPRPVSPPRPTTVRVHRVYGSVLAALLGGVEVHGPSTDKLTTTLAWTDYVDDLALDGPRDRTSTASGFEVYVRPDDRIVPLWPEDQTVPLPGWEGVVGRSTTHPLPDTRHHRVRYRFRASTRFREYFVPRLLAADPAVAFDDGQSVVSEELELSVPSTVRPDAPKVHSVLPLFRWEESEEPEQPFGRRRVRRPGLRIYLERPWNSSGDGELLAVLLAVGADDAPVYPLEKNNKPDGFPFASKWGSDPIWNSPGVPARAVTLAELDDAMTYLGFDDRVEAGRPVVAPVTLPLPLVGTGGAGAPPPGPVRPGGGRPPGRLDRRLWYVDIAFDARATFWPFVRLAVARYQPESVPGAHLSTPVRLDQVQLTPERTASVARTDAMHARVVVTGLAGHRESASRQFAVTVAQNRLLVARLQRFDPAVGGDLAWTSVDAVELAARGYAGRAEELVWVGELEADAVMDVRTPVGGKVSGGAVAAPNWRVRIEEWERFPGDPPPPPERREFREEPIWEQRLVYADDIYL